MCAQNSGRPSTEYGLQERNNQNDSVNVWKICPIQYLFRLDPDECSVDPEHFSAGSQSDLEGQGTDIHRHSTEIHGTGDEPVRKDVRPAW